MSHLPCKKDVNSVILNTDVSVDGVTLHIQTECLGSVKQIVTHTMYEGRILNSVSRSYEKYTDRVNLPDIIARVAAGQHEQQTRKAPDVWQKAGSGLYYSVHPPAENETSPVSTINQYEVPDAVDASRSLELFELGLSMVRTNPEQALELWAQAHALDPSNRACTANLNKLAMRLLNQ
jgi:hypothetical protein